MEEICREMTKRGLDTPLLVGGATTSSLHTAVKLAPLYGHVFHGADASAAAVMAKKCIMDREVFEKEQHAAQEKIRERYNRERISGQAANDETDRNLREGQLCSETSSSYIKLALADIPARALAAEDVMPYFDWKMFYAIWGVRYGSASPEAMELMQLRQDAEEEIALGNYTINLSARFHEACTDGKDIIADRMRLPMLRQESGEMKSLCDFLPMEDSGKKSSMGIFTVCVRAKNEAHEEGCCCPACSNKYEDLIAKTVRMTLAEAASKWLDDEILRVAQDDMKIIKPAAGYASCPDHTIKRDIIKMLSGEFDLGIKLTESCAMIPDASICGLIFMHPQAKYHEIRRISNEQYDDYAARRGMSKDQAHRFLGHLLK
jgi:5-methyltetrahydrofolate--homocysteine methyltransferase